MRKAIFLFINLLLCFSLFGQELPPKPNTLVTDYTGTLKADEIASLEQKLIAFNDSTSTQIAVLIMRSIGGYPIEDYAQKVYESWGIGSKDKDNGALLMVALEDRKVRIHTGYGLEGAIPDAMAKRIIENEIKPAFKEGNFYAGISQATDAMMKLATGEYTADNYHKKAKGKKGSSWFWLWIVFVIVFALIRNAAGVRRNSMGHGLGWWAAFGLLSSLNSRHRGSWGDFSSGSGDFGGGFGGFGGGSSGGGGASGSW